MALTERYVRSDAAGGGDGTTDAASGANGAFTWAEMITDLNTPRAGYRYNVKAGTYTLAATTTLTGDGTTTSPNIIRGFNSTAGDLDTQGRSSGGALNTTNFPVIAYNSTYLLNASGADYLILQNLKITGTRAGALVLATGVNDAVVRCSVTNDSTSASAIGVSLGGLILDSDVMLSGASGGDAAISVATGRAIGCRVKSVAAGIKAGSSGTALIKGCTIYECGTHGVVTTSTSAALALLDNTIVNCTGGNGVEIVTSTTAVQIIVGNHISGCLYGIEFNTSTCLKILAMNRTRDNTSGAINGGGDWADGTTIDHVTSDDADADDFTDASTDDYSLKAGAAATSQGPGYLVDIGANGTPVVTGGAGGLITHPGMAGGING